MVHTPRPSTRTRVAPGSADGDPDAAGKPLGAHPWADGIVEYRVWAPAARRVEVETRAELHALTACADGFYEGFVPGHSGDEYVFVLDGRTPVPDPCSRSQPGGVHGPSRVVDTGSLEIAPGPELPLEELVLYELHVGTFTREGTFDAVIPHLGSLRELGVTALELMPIATFPGERGWGYDGTHIYAAHRTYGGPEGLARLVDAAHRAGLAIVLDVVYNHVGPGSEALSAFGPYFTGRHSTAWGTAIDFARRGVREWAIGNAEMWTREFRVDGLRLDAVRAVHDDSPTHVLAELRQRVDGLVISEMNVSDFRPLEQWGHDAMWHDALHHELHVLLTGERDGYYAQHGTLEGLVRELRRPQREHLVVSAQNHDQVGNRAFGDRLPPDAHRVALAVVLFSLNTPLLFMGEEYEEEAPFQFFTSHVDPAIARATREGRKREFAAFAEFREEDLPDPQDPRTFERSHLGPRDADPLYRRLLHLRRVLPRTLDVRADGNVLTLRRGPVELRAELAAKTVELHGA